MSLKLLAPLTGIIGSIASVVGVSTSNSRPKDPSNTKPTQKWKIEVGTIRMGFDCSQTGGGDRGSGDVEVKLNLILYLERGETDPLLEGNTLTEKAYVELMKQGQTKKLWPIDFENEYKFMKVEWDRSAKRLKVSIGRRKSVRTGGSMEMAAERVEQKFICKTEKMREKEKGGKEI